MLDKTEQSDRVPNPNEKPESCYCSALPKGSGPCLPCYTRWLAGARKQSGLALLQNDVYRLRLMLRRSFAAVATSREDHRLLQQAWDVRAMDQGG